jgi:hypothetical protein
MEFKEIADFLVSELKEYNANSAHVRFQDSKIGNGVHIVVSAYDGEQPAHMVLEELIEWAEREGKTEILDKIHEFSRP